MRKFITEFKEFASRGDVMNLAVGIIIGGAFQSIVNSLVNDIVSPVIGIFLNMDFSSLVIILGNVEIRYGAFLTAVINFLIMAFVIFLLIKLMNKITESVNGVLHIGKEQATPTTKKCPYCMSEIDINAKKCPHCTSSLE